LLIDYLQKEQTINGQYYTTLLEKLKTAIQKKTPGMAKKKVLFYYNNAPLHSSAAVQQK
jgi:predicted transcriptional regulator